MDAFQKAGYASCENNAPDRAHPPLYGDSWSILGLSGLGGLILLKRIKQILDIYMMILSRYCYGV